MTRDNFFLGLACIMLPFWSLPFLPGTYASPLHFFTLLVSPMVLFPVKVSRGLALLSALLILGFVIAASQAILTLPIRMQDYAAYPFAVAGIIFWAKVAPNRSVDDIIRWIALFHWPMTIVSLLDLFATYVPGFGFIKYALIHPLSGTSSMRFIATTSEPSWAATLVIFYLIIFMIRYLYSRRKKYIVLIGLYSLFLIASASLAGFAFALLTAVFYLILAPGNTKKLLKIISVISLVSLLGYFSYSFFAIEGSYSYNRIAKLIDILSSIDSDAVFTSLLMVDGSLMVRIGYNYIAFTMLMDHPLGLGLGAFSFRFVEYLSLLPGGIQSSAEIQKHIIENTADPRNFWLKIGIEFGAPFLVILLLSFMRALYKRRPKNEKQSIILLASFLLAVSTQFSTIYFCVYLIVFGLILRREPKQKSPAIGNTKNR